MVPNRKLIVVELLYRREKGRMLSQVKHDLQFNSPTHCACSLLLPLFGNSFD